MVRVAVALALSLAAMPAFAAPPAAFEDVATLEARVVAALDGEVGAVGGPSAPIDRRLKLAKCPQPVTIDPPALGAVALRCASLGWRIRVPVRGAEAAPAIAAVKAAPVIRRGDPVELVAQNGAITVSTQAVAQEDGVAGGRIRVKTDSKADAIVGEVVRTGIVRVPSI